MLLIHQAASHSAFLAVEAVVQCQTSRVAGMKPCHTWLEWESSFHCQPSQALLAPNFLNLHLVSPSSSPILSSSVSTALHGMQTRSIDENSVRPSVCPSVKRANCDKMEEKSVQIFKPYERSFSLVFWEKEWLVRANLSFKNVGSTGPPLERNRRFWTDVRSYRFSRNT